MKLIIDFSFNFGIIKLKSKEKIDKKNMEG